MAALFPRGVELIGKGDHLRFFLFRMVVSKLARYAVKFQQGGHADSLADAINYTAMLANADKEGADDPVPF